MAKYANPTGFDQALAWYADCDRIFICSTEPTTYTQASATYKLADLIVTPGNGNGAFTIGDGDTSGRKITVLAQSNIDVDTTGAASWLVCAKSTDATIRMRFDLIDQSVTQGNTINTPALDYEIRQAE